MHDDEKAAELKHLGRAVRVQRARLALSQERAGSRAGMHRNYVGAIERGEINPTYETLLKLSYGLDIPLADLIATAAEEDPALTTTKARRRRRKR